MNKTENAILWLKNIRENVECFFGQRYDYDQKRFTISDVKALIESFTIVVLIPLLALTFVGELIFGMEGISIFLSLAILFSFPFYSLLFFIIHLWIRNLLDLFIKMLDIYVKIKKVYVFS